MPLITLTNIYYFSLFFSTCLAIKVSMWLCGRMGREDYLGMDVPQCNLWGLDLGRENKLTVVFTNILCSSGFNYCSSWILIFSFDNAPYAIYIFYWKAKEQFSLFLKKMTDIIRCLGKEYWHMHSLLIWILLCMWKDRIFSSVLTKWKFASIYIYSKTSFEPIICLLWRAHFCSWNEN